MVSITFEDFSRLDIRAATVLNRQPLKGAKKLAYVLSLDLGDELGVETVHGPTDRIVSARRLGGPPGAVFGEPGGQAGGRGEKPGAGAELYAWEGVVRISPERPVRNGDRLGEPREPVLFLCLQQLLVFLDVTGDDVQDDQVDVFYALVAGHPGHHAVV